MRCEYRIGSGKGAQCISDADVDETMCGSHIEFLKTQQENPCGGATEPTSGAALPRGGAARPRGALDEPRGGAAEARGGAVEPPTA